MIDATFWVAVSFLIFVGLIIYLKVPQKIDSALTENIKKIKDELDNAEKLKDEAKNILSEYETKVSKSKDEIANMLNEAKNLSDKNIIKINEEFYKTIDNRKKSAEEKIKQMKLQALKDVKNSAVEIAIKSVEKIIKNSIDKKKLDKIYISSVEEAKKDFKK